MDCSWVALATSPVGQGIGWFLGLVGFGLAAHLYGLNGWRGARDGS